MDLASVDELLTTTRSVRRRLDLSRPVEREVLLECLELALQAPTASNLQNWRFLVVTEADKKAALGELYRRSFQSYLRSGAPSFPADDPRGRRQMAVTASAVYLAENMGRVPVQVLPCLEGRPGSSIAAQAAFWGSILPAAWSFMLALRSRGLGSAWTTLHLVYEKEAAEILGIPENVTQAALLPVAYTLGAGFRPAARLPARQVTFWERWGVSEIPPG
ncbi:MAG TPA: nitroreductase family protein [Candidatus Nitrosotenuis sp.]|nr:nitroreductase family protein [Candidatus Nitrosotenuis sp.]